MTPPDCKGAPNVLLIVTDDAGYGVSSRFCGVIPAPALIANMGLPYTHFHSTALCSPSRDALRTGRNHHDLGFGIADAYTGYSGYDDGAARLWAIFVLVLFGHDTQHRHRLPLVVLLPRSCFF